jgi:hypothetical protein
MLKRCIKCTPTLLVGFEDNRKDISLRETCALFVHQLPDALQRVVAACDGLPKAIRAGILAIVV